MELSRGKVKIGAGAVLLIAASVFFCGEKFTAALILAALVHESGHLGAMALLSVPADKIEFHFGGAEITCEGRRSTYGQEALIAGAGPVMSLFLAALAAAFGRYFGGEWWYTLSGMSAVLFAFNMLPVSVLDGGGMLRGLLMQWGNAERAEAFAAAVDAVISAALVFFGIWAALGGNFTVIICAFCTVRACCKKRRNGVNF